MDEDGPLGPDVPRRRGAGVAEAVGKRPVVLVGRLLAILPVHARILTARGNGRRRGGPIGRRAAPDAEGY